PWGDGKPVAMVDVLPGRIWHAESTHGLKDWSRFFRLSGKAATLFPRGHKESPCGWFRIECTTAGLRFAGPIHRLEIGLFLFPRQLGCSRQGDRTCWHDPRSARQ